MKLGPVPEIDKGNKTTLKKFHDGFISKICDVNVIFPIFGQFRAILKLNSRRRVRNTYISITENRTNKSLT